MPVKSYLWLIIEIMVVIVLIGAALFIFTTFLANGITIKCKEARADQIKDCQEEATRYRQILNYLEHLDKQADRVWWYKSIKRYE